MYFPCSSEGPQVVKDDYYNLDNYDLNGKTGGQLQYELHRLMLDTHHDLVLYSQVNSYLQPAGNRQYSTDQINAQTAMNELFYTGKQMPLSTKIGTREHVWPCAKSGGMWVHNNWTDIKYYVDGPTYAGGGSDLYHIRPCDSTVNTMRGDSRFKEFTDAEKASGKLYAANDGGPYTLITDNTEYSNYSEPADEFKGDIARILVYVYIHYAKMGEYNWDGLCGNLSLQNVMGYDNLQDVYKVLVKWNEMDQPSEAEKLRNETVQGVQGNRNPFVDYPHLMRKCFNVK